MTALLTADEAARLRVGEQLVIVRAGDKIIDWQDMGCEKIIAPKAWVALTGPCHHPYINEATGKCVWFGTSSCPDGRRIEPLYTECALTSHHEGRWHRCEGTGRVLVGRGSIEVGPEDDGRNWRIVIDCVEVA